jgi:hypothetical protein
MPDVSATPQAAKHQQYVQDDEMRKSMRTEPGPVPHVASPVLFVQEAKLVHAAAMDRLRELAAENMRDKSRSVFSRRAFRGWLYVYEYHEQRRYSEVLAQWNILRRSVSVWSQLCRTASADDCARDGTL